MKLSKRKIIIICIDIVVISILTIVYMLNSNTEKYEFKKFTYKVPENVTFSYDETNENKFKLDGDGWKAIVEVYIDKNNDLFKYSNIYYDVMLENGVNAERGNIIKIKNREVLVYNQYEDDTKSSICYFADKNPFAYEVILYNDDNSFNTDALGEIMDILSNAKYDNRSSKKYQYTVMNFSDRLDKLQ